MHPIDTDPLSAESRSAARLTAAELAAAMDRARVLRSEMAHALVKQVVGAVRRSFAPAADARRDPGRAEARPAGRA